MRASHRSGTDAGWSRVSGSAEAGGSQRAGGKVGEEGRGQVCPARQRGAGRRGRARLPGRGWSTSAAAARAPCRAPCSPRAPRRLLPEVGGPPARPVLPGPSPLQRPGAAGGRAATRGRELRGEQWPLHRGGRRGRVERGAGARAGGRARRGAGGRARRRRVRAARAREGAAGAQGGRRRRGAGAEVGAGGGGGGRAGSVLGSARQCGAVCRASAARR